jgi:hypothetical protein
MLRCAETRLLVLVKHAQQMFVARLSADSNKVHGLVSGLVNAVYYAKLKTSFKTRVHHHEIRLSSPLTLRQEREADHFKKLVIDKPHVFELRRLVFSCCHLLQQAS